MLERDLEQNRKFFSLGLFLVHSVLNYCESQNKLRERSGNKSNLSFAPYP